MSRATQYIGLTSDAENWVSHALSHRMYTMTDGMFGEGIPGRIFEMPLPPGPNIKYTAIEVVQAAPWSSGPMIFTHLKVVLTKECGQEQEHGIAFSWVWNPVLEGEFDFDSGQMNV